MQKSGTIVAYILMFFILIAVFFFIPRDLLIRSDTDEIPMQKPVTISLYQISNVYEPREDAQNRRVITVYVAGFKDTKEVWMRMFDYANKLPLTREGITAVYFFDNRTCTPSVDYFTEEFEKIYEIHCVAGYWKYSNGTDIFRQYPFINDRE